MRLYDIFVLWTKKGADTLLGLFKKKQMPTCKQCGMVAVGLNSAGLCSVCGKDNTVNISLDNYNILKANLCCVCWDKSAVTDDYDLCEKCKATPITDTTAIYHVAQLFGLRNTEAVKSYENRITTAYDEDKDAIADIAEEYKNFCLSFGVPGRLYLEKQKNDLQRTPYEADTVGYALRAAFDTMIL